MLYQQQLVAAKTCSCTAVNSQLSSQIYHLAVTAVITGRISIPSCRLASKLVGQGELAGSSSSTAAAGIESSDSSWLAHQQQLLCYSWH